MLLRTLLVFASAAWLLACPDTDTGGADTTADIEVSGDSGDDVTDVGPDGADATPDVDAAPDTVPDEGGDATPDGDDVDADVAPDEGGDATPDGDDGGGCEDECSAGERECQGQQAAICVEVGGCLVWSTPYDCDPGEVCQDGDCVVPCTNVCSLGTKQCAAGGTQACVTGASGCTEWGPATACGTDLVCSAGECVCTNQCADGATQCDPSGGVQTCSMADSGCTEWEPAVDCPGSEVCSGGACVATCSDQCLDGATQCDAVSGGVQTCQVAASGCTEWSPAVACSTGQACESGACVDTCSDACTEGNVQCDSGGGGVQTCEVAATGCTAWSAPVACGSGQACDAGACVDTCSDACTDGATQCDPSGGGVQTCESAASGCLAWSDPVACGAQETCEDGACVATCTDECTDAATQCAPDDAGVQTCAVAASGCTEWSAPVACGADQTCLAGACEADCNECTAGQQQCDGADVQSCILQAGCWVWSGSYACETGQTCVSGACEPLPPGPTTAWSHSFQPANSVNRVELAVDASGRSSMMLEVYQINSGPVGGLDGAPALGYAAAGGGIARLDTDGTPLWYRGYGNDGEALAVAVADDGSTFAAGVFEDDFKFGASDGPTTPQWGNCPNMFLARYDAAGALVWLNTYHHDTTFNCASMHPVAMARAPDGTLAVYVEASGTVDFTDDGVDNPIGATIYSNWFLVRFDSDGGYLQAKTGGGYALDDREIAADGTGRVALFGTASSGKLVLMVVDGGDEYAFGTTFEDDQNKSAGGVAFDPDGNIVVGGAFQGGLDLGDGEMVAAGGYDLFVAKFDSAGGLLWAQQYGDGSNQLVKGLDVAPDGSILLAGQVQGELDFGPVLLQSAGTNADAFLARFTSDGAPLWAAAWGNAQWQSGEAVRFGPGGSIIGAGAANSAGIDFGQGDEDGGWIVRLDPAP